MDARPNSRPRPRLRPRRGGALERAAGPQAAGPGVLAGARAREKAMGRILVGRACAGWAEMAK